MLFNHVTKTHYSTSGQKLKKVSLLIIALGTPSITAAQTLEQAVAKAFDSHPELRVALAKFKIAEENVQQAHSDYKPLIDLTALAMGLNKPTAPEHAEVFMQIQTRAKQP